MNQTIAIFNFKGGVGKTTSALNLANYWSSKYRVLVMDFDPQCNLTKTLLSGNVHDKTIYYYIKAYLHNNLLDLTPVKVRNQLHVLPGDYELTALDSNSLFIEFGSQILHRILQQVRGRYDIILIDCPTYFGKTVKCVLDNADHVLIPATPDLFSIRGALRLIKYVKTMDHPKPVKILGLYFNRFRARLIYHQKIRMLAKRLFANLMIDKTVRNAIKISEASDQQLTDASDHSPYVAADFATLGSIVERRLEKAGRKGHRFVDTYLDSKKIPVLR